MSKRQTFGVLINQLAGGFQAQLWPGIMEGVKENDVNVIFYCGKIPLLDYKDFYQHEAAFHLVSSDVIDGLISLTVAVGYAYNEGFDEFMERYAHIPTVSLCRPLKYAKTISFNGVEGTKEAVKHLIEDHDKKRVAFIRGPETHSDAADHFRGYCEALEECGIELDESIVVPALMDKSGGVEAMNHLLSRGVKFDAVATSNDEQAIGAALELKEQGIDIPNDVALTGHDNILETTFNVPKITTVNQPTFEMGYESVGEMLSVLETGQGKDIVLKTHLVRRESCGCFSDVIENIQAGYIDDSDQAPSSSREDLKKDIDKTQLCDEKRQLLSDMLLAIINEPISYEPYQLLARKFQSLLSHDPLNTLDNKLLHRLLNHVRNIVQQEHDFSNQDFPQIERNFLFLRTSLNYSEQAIESTNLHKIACSMFKMRDASASVFSAVNYEELVEQLDRELINYDIDECYICLYEQSFTHTLKDSWSIPKKSRLLFAAQDFRSIDLTGKPCDFDTLDLVPEWLKPQDRAYTWAVMPLLARNRHYGFIIHGMGTCDPGLNDERFESLRDIVSTVVENVNLFNRITEYKEELEEKNARLHRQAITDELTGLHNRHGFMNMASQCIKKNKDQGSSMALLFADMDGLKNTNDTYGHAEGDAAIKVIAQALNRAFRYDDLMARLAGDEFVVMMSNVRNEEAILEALKRIEAVINEANNSAQYPYFIALSTGYVYWNPLRDTSSLETLMARADERLYANKRLRKQSEQFAKQQKGF